MLRRLFAVWMLLFVATALSFAQFSGLNLPSLEYNPVLLINPKVQQELKLSPTKAASVQNAFMEEAFKIMPAVTGGGANSKPLTPAQRTKLMTTGVSRMQTRLVAMLTPAQRVRLRQLSLQSIGPAAVLQPKVATSLGLSPKQRSSLTQSIGAANSRVAKGFSMPGTSDQWQGRMKAMEALQNQAKAASNKALMATLTPAQKLKWKALLGKPFAMSGFLGVGGGLPNMGG